MYLAFQMSFRNLSGGTVRPAYDNSKYVSIPTVAYCQRPFIFPTTGHFKHERTNYVGVISNVATKINNMKENKSPGVDWISPKILKETVKQISTPLAHMFNMSLQEEIVPLE